MTQDQSTQGVVPAEAPVESAAPPVETAPEEIEHDALQELDRIHQAQRFGASGDDWMGGGSFDAGYGMSTPMGSVSHAYDPAVVREERQRVPVSRELRTLEDLYDAYPEIGGGSYLLRICRKRPTTWQGFKIDGWLEDLNEQISMAEFSTRFGGGLYEVSVCGPGRAVALEADGRVHTRTLTTIQINIHGQPVVSGYGRGDGEERMVAPSYGREDPRLSLRKLDLEADRERRRDQEEKLLRRELAGQRVIDPALLKQIAELADQRGKETKSFAAETISQLKEDLKRYHLSVEDKDKQIQALREKLLQVQNDAALRWREEESRQVREVKDRHEQELRSVKDQFAAEIKRMQTEHTARVEDLSKQASRERDMVQQAETRERDKIREDASRREKQLQDDSRNTIENMRLSYESRLSEMERVHDRELRNLREDRDRAIQGVQLSESTKSTLAEKAADIKTTVMAEQLARVQTELNSTKRELTDARAQNQPKDVMTTIREAHELTAMTQGASDKEEEGEFDWKRGLFNALQGIVEKAPEIAENLGKAREENRQTVERMRQQQIHAAASAQQGRHPMQPGMMPQHPGAPRRVAPPAPPMGIAPHVWDGSMGPPDPGAPIGVPPAPPWPPMADMSPPPRAHHIGSRPPVAPAPPPATGGPRVPMEASPAQPETAQQDMPQQSATESGTPEPSVPPQDGALQITQEQVASFSEQLEAAIATNVVTPKQFAEGFVQTVGPDAARELLTRMEPDQLVDAIQAQPQLQESHIVTRKGRKFVRQLWIEAAQLIR